MLGSILMLWLLMQCQAETLDLKDARNPMDLGLGKAVDASLDRISSRLQQARIQRFFTVGEQKKSLIDDVPGLRELFKEDKEAEPAPSAEVKVETVDNDVTLPPSDVDMDMQHLEQELVELKAKELVELKTAALEKTLDPVAAPPDPMPDTVNFERDVPLLPDTPSPPRLKQAMRARKKHDHLIDEIEQAYPISLAEKTKAASIDRLALENEQHRVQIEQRLGELENIVSHLPKLQDFDEFKHQIETKVVGETDAPNRKHKHHMRKRHSTLQPEKINLKTKKASLMVTKLAQKGEHGEGKASHKRVTTLRDRIDVLHSLTETVKALKERHALVKEKKAAADDREPFDQRLKKQLSSGFLVHQVKFGEVGDTWEEEEEEDEDEDEDEEQAEAEAESKAEAETETETEAEAETETDSEMEADDAVNYNEDEQDGDDDAKSHTAMWRAQAKQEQEGEGLEEDVDEEREEDGGEWDEQENKVEDEDEEEDDEEDENNQEEEEGDGGELR